MRTSASSRARLLLAFLLGASTACDEGEATLAPPPVEQVELRPLAPELFVGQRLLLEALPTDRDGEDLGYRPTVWASSDESVATVTIGGLVEGIAPGEARISATIEGVEGSVVVTVVPTPLGRVAVDPGSLNLAVGESEALAAKALDVLGGEIDGATFEWSSSDEAVAGVDPEGRVRALGPGAATISASFEGTTGSADVRVVAARIDRLVARETDVSIYTGQTRELKVEVIDTNEEVRPEASVSWRSKAPFVADVDENGLVRAWSPGRATIVASLVDLEVWIYVTVSRMPVSRVEVEPKALTAYAGERIKLSAFVFGLEPEPIGEAITWSSSDERLATVDGKGEVSLLQRGEVVIRATAGGVIGSASITIRRSPAIERIETTSVINAPMGETKQLEAKVFDVEGARVLDLPLEWRSADPAIASIDESSGEVQGHEIGAVDVTVSVDGVSASVLVNVYEPFAVGEVGIIGDTSELLLGERRLFRTKVFDSQGAPADYLLVRWTSSDESVATVASGEVVARTSGEVTISAEVGGVVSAVSLESTSIEYAQIRVRGQRICGLTTAGELYCWGARDLSGGVSAPTKILGGGTFRDFSVGGRHVCVIDHASKAFCGGDNSVSQLGDGTTTHSLNAWVPVAGGHEFRSIEAGSSMSCGVTLAGKGYCWGKGIMGAEPQILFDSPVPSLISDELIFSSIIISSWGMGLAGSGYTASCGLTTSDRAYCWGVNHAGELGDGTVLPSLVPVAVGGGLSFSSLTLATRSRATSDPPSMATTRGHGCGINLEGDAYCWGSNASGELGIGTESLQELLPTKVVGGHWFKEIHAETHWDPWGLDAMDATSCALDQDGKVFCWGLNDILLPSVAGVPQRSPLPIGGDMRFESISLGADRLCGMATNGKAYCWGYNWATSGAQDSLGVYDQELVVSEPSLVLGQAPDPPPTTLPLEGTNGLP